MRRTLLLATMPTAMPFSKAWAIPVIRSPYVSTLALDEVIFAILQLKVAEDHPDIGFWEVYRENATVIRK
jgi:hypothetical protein